MTFATGIYKQLVAKRQAGLGTKATAGSAQTFRRVTSTLDLEKSTFKSNEIRPSQQRADMRHGIRSVPGTISGELSPGTYQDFMESTLRADASAAASSSALTNVTAAVTTGAQGTFTRAAGSWLTDGFKIGMVVRFTGWTAPATANNAHNFLIIALTATVMTVLALDGVAIVAKASGDSVTAAEAGKHIAIPQTGHTKDYWTIEHNHSDIAQSEQYKDCVFSQMAVKLNPNNIATVDFSVMGIDVDTSTAAYFTSPAAVGTGTALAAPNGVLVAGGAVVGFVTGFDWTVNGNCSYSDNGVVGSNKNPDVFTGPLDVNGNMSALFQDATLRDAFINETEMSLIIVLTSDNTAASAFQSHVFPRIKYTGAKKDDGEKAITQSLPWTALENVAGGASASQLATTYWVQDSAAV